jgi:hypothetical protein
MTENQPPTFVSSMSNATVSKGQTYTHSFAGFCTDPEHDTLTLALFVDNTLITDSTTGSEYSYVSATETFTFNF